MESWPIFISQMAFPFVLNHELLLFWFNFLRFSLMHLRKETLKKTVEVKLNVIESRPKVDRNIAFNLFTLLRNELHSSQKRGGKLWTKFASMESLNNPEIMRIQWLQLNWQPFRAKWKSSNRLSASKKRTKESSCFALHVD